LGEFGVHSKTDNRPSSDRLAGVDFVLIKTHSSRICHVVGFDQADFTSLSIQAETPRRISIARLAELLPVRLSFWSR
jgi:hypothetical protein